MQLTFYGKPKPPRKKSTGKLNGQTQSPAERAAKRRQEKANALVGASLPAWLDQPAATAEELNWRHGNWQPKRALVRQALIQTGIREAQLWSYDNCGANVIIEWSEAEKRHRMRGSYCKNRHCEPCARQKANIIARNLQAKLENAPNENYRFITLTLKHTAAPLTQQIARLYASFRKLRAQKCWRTTQRGGSASLEVKWQPATREWHPHLHVISQGSFLHKRDLTEAWLHCTGDSYIADIRVIADAKAASYYVGKYVTKGTNDEVWSSPDAAQEWVTATKGVRTCATFGKWRGFALTKFVPTANDWKPVATLDKVSRAARAGEDWAIAIMISLTPSAKPEEVRARYKMDTGDG